jgi:alkylation response protein AidB-like acyl-CoA dehydrogenase
MDFDISEDLKMVQSLARDFVRDQLKPLERDLLGRAADLSDARMSLPAETEARLVKTAKDMGLWGASIPEELGGVGLNTLGNCLIEEELAQTVVPFNLGDVTPILFECNEKQRAKYFTPAFNREKSVYLAIMEPDREADVPAMGIRAKKAEGHFILNGKKLSLSRPAQDYFAVVFAVTGDNGPRNAVTCFLVDKGTPGFTVIGGEEKKGWQSGIKETLRLVFENCRVPVGNVLGKEGKAFSLGQKWLPSRRLIRGARSVGVAQRLLEEATTRAQSWQSFGQLMAQQPSVQAALAEIATDIHAGRLMVYEAAWKADKGEPVRREAAMVKLFATRLIHNVADRVAHIYGGPPYLAGQPMERLCRQALATSATELALELQRNIISRDILKGLKV